jgi:hypothetical protein
MTMNDDQARRCMSAPVAVIALCACALCLGACDKTSTTPAMPKVDKLVPTESGAATGSAAHPSVPSAEAAFPPASAGRADQTQGRSDGTRVPSQGSTGVQMPGQNNDHSAPLGSSSHASAP